MNSITGETMKLIVSDVDGVLTDSKINIGEEGELFKSFNVKDGYAIVNWREAPNHEFVIVTSRSSAAVENRASELGVREVHQGVSDKGKKIKEIALDLGYQLEETVYIGDDIGDIDAMDRVGLACCPADAPKEVRNACEYVSRYSGGEGAVRDIIEYAEGTSLRAVGVIPARYGSTRLPGKPLVNLVGKPMIQHVYERACQADQLDSVIVATDDERILEAVESFDGTAMMTDSNHPTGTDRVAEVAEQINAELIINIQGDEPLIEPSVIDNVVEALRRNSPGVATPIAPISDECVLEDENTVKVVTDKSGRALYFSRSKIPSNGGVNDTYKHIGLYGFETDVLLEFVEWESELEGMEDLEQLRLLENGYDIQTVETAYDATEVNVEKDIPMVEKMLQQNDDARNS